MPFRISITSEAESHLQGLSARERGIVTAAVETKLSDQPTIPTRSVKQLRPNPFAQFELRVGDLRVLYNLEGDEVILLVVGRKEGNKLIVGGHEFHGHQDNPPKPTGGESAEDTQ